MKIGVVVVGAGRMGSIHASNIRRIQRAELLAIVDPDIDRARKLGEAYGVPYYAELETALKSVSGKARAAVIASPLTAHLENIRVVSEYGLDIFVEKPMAPSLSECREIVRIVRSRGIKLQIGYQRRFDKNYQEVKRVLLSGQIGKILLAKFIARDPMPEPGVGLGRIYRGALFDDMVTHEFDLVSWLLGYPPERLVAFGATLYFNVEDYDNAIINIEYRGGPLVNIEVTRCSAYGHDLRLEILGAEGLVKMDNTPETQVYLYGRQGLSRMPRLPWFAERFSDAYYREMESFIEAIARDEKPSPDEEDGLRACVLSEAAKRSALEGRVVSLAEILG
ncbi:MAG: Gfo/Idh/MocA family oxidoreductase [Sulfolobales archaeon]